MSRNYNTNNTLNPYTVNGYEISPHDHYGYKIIAVIHGSDFWCAYKGLTDWSDEHVAEGGDAIPYEVAKALFPTIDAVVPSYND
jgi:hypothetical protein